MFMLDVAHAWVGRIDTALGSNAALRSKRRAERRGRFAEWWAALFLQCKGYRVLARRYRTRRGEVDLIVRRGRVIAFVEVKQRQSVLAGLDAVTPRAQRRIAAAGRSWLVSRRVGEAFEVRCDVVVLLAFSLFKPRTWSLPAHFRDAWPEDPLG